jgi:hypothetical protein
MQPAPQYRGLRLDGSIEELHRALDRLRWDTVPAPLDRQQPPRPPTRRRQDPTDGQAVLLEEASCTSTCT